MSGTWHVVTGDFPPRFSGGVATWMLGAARALAGDGGRVVVHARASGIGWTVAERRFDRTLPFEVHRVAGRSWNARQTAHVARAVLPRLSAQDRVLAATWTLAVDLAAPCRDRRVPLVVLAHGSDVTRLGLATPPGLVALSGSARFLAVSAFLVRALATHGVSASVVPSPVDPCSISAEAREGLLVVARLTPLKGVDRALKLASALGWPITVAGEGPERTRLGRLAGALGSDAIFTGRREGEALDLLYRRTACLVLLSRPDDRGAGAEGLGLVVLEAAARGTPAVVSDVGGLPEAARAGCVLRDPDDLEAAVDRVCAFLAEVRVGERARAWLAATHGAARTREAIRTAAKVGPCT
ncbi:MAG: glycosyltransferase family 4 protein [Deltaproteobacteria bacterium]|nr:glycosyltransferase family 4 protein [Deltaproteobacteria bacterium]